MGLLLFVLAAIKLAIAFFGLRWVAARASGVRGARVIFGIEHAPWANVSLPRRAAFAFAGPLGCYLVAAGFVAGGLMMSGRDDLDETSMRVAVAPEGPAAVAGLVAGDRIVSVNDAPIADWGTLKATIAKHPSEQIRVVVERGGQTLTLTPNAAGKILVGPAAIHRDVGLGSALGEGLATPPRIWWVTVKSFVAIFAGRESAEVSGPVAIVRETDRAATQKLGNGLRLVGVIVAYLLWMPTVVALVFFPRPRRRRPGA